MKEVGLLSVHQYFGRSTNATLAALALALACAVFVVAAVVHVRGKGGLRKDVRLAAVDVM
jgi:hypothetical protein